MADIKNKLFNYFAQRHFDLMPPEVRARFDDYAKHEDFQGHMKHWNDNFKGAATPDLVNDVTGGSNTYNLTDEEWKELYDAYQEVFLNMDIAKIPSIGFDNEYKKATKDFISKWFGNYADGKVFVQQVANHDFAEELLSTGPDNLADFLHQPTPPVPPDPAARSALKDVLKNNLKDSVFSDISYDDFINGLRAKRYNTDAKFKEKALTVVRYIRDNGPEQTYQIPSRTQWPLNVGYTSTHEGSGIYTVATVNPTLAAIYGHSDTNTWFVTPNRNECVDRFKAHYTEIFDTLLTNSKVREHFLAQTQDRLVSEPLLEAIKQTDYENKESKDYVPDKYSDEKHWTQKFQDWKDDTYEDHLRRFVNPSRGTRLFFSPWSQDIIKAFDKEKIKPTDGLEGILSKKDAIAGRLKTKTPSDHFKWFTDTLSQLKDAGMGKAIEGALRNGKQLRQVASAIIAEAVEQDKIKEAKTALEILSVAKYGMLCSRTFDKLHEATKDMKIFSDKDLSWNKNEGVQFVTKAMDKTAGIALQGIALAATGLRNAISLSHTKIDGNIKNNKILDKAHKHWNEEDSLEEINKSVKTLDDLAAGNGKSGQVITPATITAQKAALDAMPDGDAKDNLKADIDAYDKLAGARAEKRDIEARQAARADKDPYKELVAYWNMLETATKTHTFALGNMSVKRKDMLKDFANGNSMAQQKATEYLNNFNSWRTA